MNTVIPTINYDEIDFLPHHVLGFGDYLWISPDDYRGVLAEELQDDEEFYIITIYYRTNNEFKFRIKKDLDLLYRLQGRLKQCRDKAFRPIESLTRNPINTESFLLSQCSNVITHALNDYLNTVEKDNVSGVSLIVNGKHITIAENLSKKEAEEMVIDWTERVNSAKRKYMINE